MIVSAPSLGDIAKTLASQAKREIKLPLSVCRRKRRESVDWVSKPGPKAKGHRELRFVYPNVRP